MQTVKFEAKVKEAEETINAPEEVEHAKVETSDNDILSKLLFSCNVFFSSETYVENAN